MTGTAYEDLPQDDLNKGVQMRDWQDRRSRLIQDLCSNEEDVDFATLAGPFREIVPHSYFAYAVFRTTDARIERLYNLDFPAPVLRLLSVREDTECRIIQQWLQNREPMVIDPIDPIDSGAPAENPELVGCGTVVVHAQVDLAGLRAVVFFLGDVTPSKFGELRQQLRVITPFLYAAAVRAMRRSVAPKARHLSSEPLTRREIEVLRWVYHGKTNEEISRILRISVFTVKNHIQRVLIKLNATNRVQAVLRASEAGLLQERDRTRLIP